MLTSKYLKALPPQVIMMLDYYYLEKLSHAISTIRLKHSLRVGLTHGVFNHFHQGHKYFIDSAKKYCDLLIIAVDSDNKPSQYKMTSRPLQKDVLRLHCLQKRVANSFSFINYLPFSEMAYRKLYKLINPDLIFIGSGFGALEAIQKRTKAMGITLIELRDNEINEYNYGQDYFQTI